MIDVISLENAHRGGAGKMVTRVLQEYKYYKNYNEEKLLKSLEKWTRKTSLTNLLLESNFTTSLFYSLGKAAIYTNKSPFQTIQELRDFLSHIREVLPIVDSSFGPSVYLTKEGLNQLEFKICCDFFNTFGGGQLQSLPLDSADIVTCFNQNSKSFTGTDNEICFLHSYHPTGTLRGYDEFQLERLLVPYTEKDENKIKKEASRLKEIERRLATEWSRFYHSSNCTKDWTQPSLYVKVRSRTIAKITYSLIDHTLDTSYYI